MHMQISNLWHMAAPSLFLVAFRKSQENKKDDRKQEPSSG